MSSCLQLITRSKDLISLKQINQDRTVETIKHWSGIVKQVKWSPCGSWIVMSMANQLLIEHLSSKPGSKDACNASLSLELPHLQDFSFVLQNADSVASPGAILIATTQKKPSVVQATTATPDIVASQSYDSSMTSPTSTTTSSSATNEDSNKVKLWLIKKQDQRKEKSLLSSELVTEWHSPKACLPVLSPVNHGSSVAILRVHDTHGTPVAFHFLTKDANARGSTSLSNVFSVSMPDSLPVRFDHLSQAPTPKGNGGSSLSNSSLNASTSSLIYASFTRADRGKPATISVFSINVPSCSGTSVSVNLLASKTLFKADRADFYWSPTTLSPSLLVITHVDVDKTGRSYYGEDMATVFTNIDASRQKSTQSMSVSLDKEGPIHDIAWHPKGTEFVLIYGFMPAKIGLFNARGDLVYSFPASSTAAPKNMVRYNEDGALIALAGFGNLSGAVEIWGRHRMNKLCALQAPNTTVLSWTTISSMSTSSNSLSGHSQHFLGATLTPRMRVDNGYKVWSWRGELIAQEAISDLYQVLWRPGWDVLPLPDGSMDSLFAAVDKEFQEKLKIEGNGEMTAQASTTNAGVGAYVPPALRNKTQQPSAASLTKSSSIPQANMVINNLPLPPAPSVSLISKEERQIRRLREKLAAIEELRAKQKTGQHLEANQLAKLDAENKLRAELADLERGVVVKQVNDRH